MKRLFGAAFWTLGGLLIPSLGTSAIPEAERSSTTGGFGAWMIDSLFEAGSLGGAVGSQAGFLGTVIQPFSLVCMLVVVAIVLVKSTQHVLIVAQAKDVESSPIAMTWAPIHLVFAVALAMPLSSGYSGGQYAAIWVAEQSNFLGNVIAEKTVDGSEYGVFTEVPLPAVRQTVLGLIDSQICQAVMNSMGSYMAAQQNSRLQINTRSLSSEQIQVLFGNPNQELNSAGLTRNAVAYEVERIGSSGDFLNRPTDINTTCGSMLVEYDSYYSDGDFVSFDTTNQERAADNCNLGILCTTTQELYSGASRVDDRRLASDAFETAHKQITSEFLGAAGIGGSSSVIPDAVEKLTFDIDGYFSALLDGGSMEEYRINQLSEKLNVDSAANTTVSEIARLQRAIYDAYGGALSTLRSRNTETNDSHSDAVMKTGWTVLGLYWFQQHSYNSQVLEAVNFNVRTNMSTPKLIATVREVTGDDLLARRLEERIGAFKAKVNQEILNSRLDPNPLTAVGNNAIDDSSSGSIRAMDVKESLPTYIDTMIESAAQNQGVSISDPYGYDIFGSPSTFFRNYVFPGLIWTLRDENLVTGLVNLGHYMIGIAEIGYVVSTFYEAFNEWAIESNQESLISKVKGFFMSAPDQAAQEVAGAGAGTLIGKIIAQFMSDLQFLLLYFFLLGLFLAFYLPAIVMIQWMIGIVQWLIYIIEATIVIPLWAILFVSDMGQKAFAPQTAQQGLIHLLSILMYPALMVIGFTIGMKVLDVISYFTLDYIELGFLNITAGYTFGLVSALAGLTIIGIIAYQIIVRIFSGMLELHDRAISWIGNKATFGENQSEQATRAALVGFIGRGENLRKVQPNKKGPEIGKPNSYKT